MVFDPELGDCCGSSSRITWPPFWISFTGGVSMAACAWSLYSSLALSGLCLLMIEGMAVCGDSDSLAVLCGVLVSYWIVKVPFWVQWYQSTLVLSLMALGLKLPSFWGLRRWSLRLKLWLLSFVDFGSSLISVFWSRFPFAA